MEARSRLSPCLGWDALSLSFLTGGRFPGRDRPSVSGGRREGPLPPPFLPLVVFHVPKTSCLFSLVGSKRNLSLQGIC